MSSRPERRRVDGPVRRVTLPPIAPEPVADRPADGPTAARLAAALAPAPDAPAPAFEYRKPKKRRWVRQTALGLGLVTLAVVGWFGYKTFAAADNIIDRSNGVAPGLVRNLDVTKLKGEGDGRVNILMLGIGGQGHEAPNLSDTMMVMSIDPKTKDVAMLSIPRDLYVKIPASAKNREQYGKINSANALGGPIAAEKAVQAVIGVPIHYYVQVDFSGFKQAVDAVGGVDINVTKAIQDPYYPCDNGRGVCGFSIKAGLQHMNGTMALRYARSRKTTSDFDRAARQQQVMAAVREKALQLSTLTNPVKLNGLLDTLDSHLKTDMQLPEIKKLAAIMKDVNTAKITSKVLDTGKEDSLLIDGSGRIPGAGSIELPKLGSFSYADIQDFVKNIFVDHYITDENARLEVQNGSGVSGLAASVVTSLKAAHYNLLPAANAEGQYGTTVIYDYTNGKKPYTINYLEKRFGVKAQKRPVPSPSASPAAGATSSTAPSAAPEIRIILGSDYQRTGDTD